MLRVHFLLNRQALPFIGSMEVDTVPETGGSGLLVAANEESWRALHDRLLAQNPVSVDLTE